ncbi:MAG TPA: ANTAR domain-containing protein [Nocardioidaceae bacterium]|nr:ANTAR domain-containing protein [Nocardioidaceae bacterium]
MTDSPMRQPEDQPEPVAESYSHGSVIEQAKGALMLRYGIGSYHAFASLLRWSRGTNTPMETVAHTLVRDICRGGHREPRDPELVRWLDDRHRGNMEFDSIPVQRSARSDP